MAIVTKTIGTSSRDYSTMTLWEADIDDGGIYSASDDAVGECYDDSDFNESVTFNGGGTIGLTSATLTVASGEEHDGTAGTGVVNVLSSGTQITATNPTGVDYFIEKIDWDASAATSLGNNTNVGGNSMNFQQNLVHGGRRTNNRGGITGNRPSGTGNGRNILNNIVYDIENTVTGNVTGIGMDTAGSRSEQASNNTIFKINNNGATGTSTGLAGLGSNAAQPVRNDVVCDVGGSSSGTKECIDTSFTGSHISHNATSDTTSSGTGSIDSVVTADQFVSTTGGSEDLHIKNTSADIFEAGTDLVTTPIGINIDADGFDRNAGATTWSIGAFDGNELRGVANDFPFQRYYLGGAA